MDLLRIPGLLLYMIRLLLARSVAERRNVKRVRQRDRVCLSCGSSQELDGKEKPPFKDETRLSDFRCQHSVLT